MSTNAIDAIERSGNRGPGGRQRLIEAALELASTTRSLASLGLREVTRCAGLAPNSFYRHFKSFDDLGLAAVEMLGSELRSGLRERRRRATKSARPPIHNTAQLLSGSRALIRETVGLVLDFVGEHPTAWIVGMRELNGSSPAMRQAIQQLLEDFASDMAEDVRLVVEIPGVEPKAIHEISRQVIRQMMFFSMDYLEQPQRRAEIREQAERFILRMFAGEMAMIAASPAKAPATARTRIRKS